MYSAGRNARLDEGETEIFDNLNLVGINGRFCGILTERQLTFQDWQGFGIRISLSNISTLRNINLSKLPAGFLTMGFIGIWSGFQILLPPLGWGVIAASIASIGAYLKFKTPVLVIETNAGDKYLVTTSQSELMRLCMMIDRVMHGSTVSDAKAGLKMLENERLKNLEKDPIALLNAPEEIASLVPEPTISSNKEAQNVVINEPLINLEKSNYPTEGLFASLEQHEPSTYESESSEKPSAYEGVWGREEPSWYQEKEIKVQENRIEDAFSNAMESFNLFDEGGILDSESYNYAPNPTTPSYGSNETSNSISTSVFEDPNNLQPVTNRDRIPSSSQMIKSAQQRFGISQQNNSQERWGLPSPTENAVRDECKPGLVKTAKARQAYNAELIDNNKLKSSINSEQFGDDFPAVTKMANSMGNGRVRNNPGPRKRNWLESILKLGSNRDNSDGRSYVREYGDSDRVSENQTERLRSSQILRLRADQDHQADIVSRLNSRSQSRTNASSARDVLDDVVNRIVSENSISSEESENEKIRREGGLRFSQLRPTSRKDDALPGIRQLK